MRIVPPKITAPILVVTSTAGRIGSIPKARSELAAIVLMSARQRFHSVWTRSTSTELQEAR